MEARWMHDVIIVGTGFAGVCMAVRLLKAGFEDIAILEKGREVGGTWRDNTYPGASCDVQSHLYSLSFEPNPHWSQRCAGADEIQRYLLDVVERYALRRFVRFGEEVVSARFDATAAAWYVETRGGRSFRARHLVLATGPLHVPRTGGIPGLERFGGRVFHSSRWDHDYDLAGKRVASIGTGASAVQYAPSIAPLVGRLHVFQRTAPWVIPRDTRPYTEAQRRRFARHPWLRRLHRAALYWQNELRLAALLYPALARLPEALCKRDMRKLLPSPGLVRALTPSFRFGCKRILLSNDWYPMFLRDNVELVTSGIREIRTGSVVTEDGQERAVDCIVLGTGFVTDPRDAHRGLTVTGTDGVTLEDAWRHGAWSYYGVHVAGFPNLHRLAGPNSGLGHNSIVFMIEAQADYVVRCLRALRRRGDDWLDVIPSAQTAFCERVREALEGTAWVSGCKSWYQGADGQHFLLWPWSTVRYWLWSRSVAASHYRFGRALAQTGRRERATHVERSLRAGDPSKAA